MVLGGWWVGVGRSGFLLAGLALAGRRFVLVGLGWVRWGWSMLVCASGFGVGGLIHVRLCLWVWGWWAGVGRARLAGYVALCWPIFGLCWVILGLCWPILVLCWPILGLCRPILELCWPILGLCWPILGQCWPILGLGWPILELCWPILGLSWPILGLCWPILRPMLAHLEAYLGPCWPILSHQIRKMGKNAKSTKHRKTREFLATRGGRRQGRRPLSPTERRELPYNNATARGPLAGFKGCRPCRRPRKVGQSAWSGQAAKQHLIACRNRAQTYPQKLPNVPSEFLENYILFYFLQLLFGGSKLQASGLQKGPFATAKQHLIACRNRAQTYPQKLPNVPSEFLENYILFYFLQLLFGGSKLQASGLQKGPFAIAKQHLIACRNRAQTYPQKLPNVPSEFLEKYPFLLPAAVVWWLQAASIRPPEGTLRHSKTAPNCVPKPCSNLPTKTA